MQAFLPFLCQGLYRKLESVWIKIMKIFFTLEMQNRQCRHSRFFFLQYFVGRHRVNLLVKSLTHLVRKQEWNHKKTQNGINQFEIARNYIAIIKVIRIIQSLLKSPKNTPEKNLIDSIFWLIDYFDVLFIHELYYHVLIFNLFTCYWKCVWFYYT